MNRFIHLPALLLLIALYPMEIQAHTEEEIIYDRKTEHSLDAFRLFLEKPEKVRARPRLALSAEGLEYTPGEGHFTAWEFADLDEGPFALDVIFEAPHALESNSGIFLLMADPREDFTRRPAKEQDQYIKALAKASKRRKELGGSPGPFELDYFAYEVQIARGDAEKGVPDNKKTGAFYGVPVGEKEGEQQILNLFELYPGDQYNLRIESGHRILRTYLKSVHHQSEFVPIAQMETKSKSEDVIRGGLPRKLLIQSYWNNGTTARPFVFKSIRLD